MKALEIEKIKKIVKRMPENGIRCKAQGGQKIDGTVCMINQIRKPHQCVEAGCRRFKEEAA